MIRTTLPLLLLLYLTLASGVAAQSSDRLAEQAVPAVATPETGSESDHGITSAAAEAAAGASYDPLDPLTVVMRQVDAYNARDLKAFPDYYHEDATYYFLWPDTSSIVLGKAAIRERFSFLNEVPADGFGVDVTDTLVTGRFVVLTERFRSAPAADPDVLLVYEVQEGLISNTWVHYPEPFRPSLAVEEGEWPIVELTAAELALYQGTYGTADAPVRVRVNDEGRLQWSSPGEHFELVPEGDHVFAAGRYEEGRVVEIFHPDIRLAFELEESEVVGYEVRWAEGGAVLHEIPRIR